MRRRLPPQPALALDLTLENLAQRAGRQWDRLSQWMVFREQIQPFLQFSQMAILAALLYLVVKGVPAFTLAWPSYEVIAWIGLGCIPAAGMLYVAHNHAWLRRLVVSSLLIASVVPTWKYASLPRLFELRDHSVTYMTERISDKQAGWETVQAPTANPKFLDTIPEGQDNKPLPLPTTTPTFQSAVDFRVQPQTTSPQTYGEDHSWTIPCCQPR